MKPQLPEIVVRTAPPIIEKFGGVQKMSDITGHPYGRIDGWLRGGVIPEKYRYHLLVIAKREGIAHTPWDYIAHLVDIRIAA
jgi:hypothetical protein